MVRTVPVLFVEFTISRAFLMGDWLKLHSMIGDLRVVIHVVILTDDKQRKEALGRVTATFILALL